MDIKAVVFDCDGVMFDTAKVNREFYNRVLAHFGRPEMTDEQFEYVHMHTVLGSFAYLFDNDEDAVQAALDHKKQVSYLSLIKYMEMEPALIPLLKTLKGRYNLAIATNRSDTMGQVLVDHSLEEYFDIVVTALDVPKPKPHPDQLEKILDHFGIRPEEALFIGDSPLDEQAAVASGVRFAAYCNQDLSAEFHIRSLKEVETIVGPA